MREILLPPNRLTRLWNSYRRPDEAALLARVPLAGRRVPLRALWHRRRLSPTALVREMTHAAPHPPGLPIHAFSGVRARIRGAAARRRAPAAAADEAAVRPIRVSSRVRRGSAIAGVVALGALLMYYLDPASGRRRRALVRDQLVHARNVVLHRLPGRVEKRGRFIRGLARGIRHEAAGVVLHGGHDGHVDDETLVARVRSEVLGRREVKAGAINVDAYEGTVTLRGQLEHPDEIRRLIDDTSHVEGVRRVRSYLHLPGTLAPNKAEIYELEHAPYDRG
ncbi:MAG: BON domain-containing protein [Chloroflexota bacterium]|nr:BON domain-containing protein [Chloroflexota bacterium]